MSRSLAAALFAASAPRVPHAHLFETGGRRGLLVVAGSQVFQADPEMLLPLQHAVDQGDADRVTAELDRLDLDLTPAAVARPGPPRLHALSLAVAQKCNLGCTYCYARGGSFGGPSRQMSLEIACAATDRLLDGIDAGGTATLSFLGGEPLANRAVLRAATEYAVRRAAARDVRLSLAITTNGTLLTEADADFFEAHGFAVTVSLDGVGEVHDRLRPFKDGRGSYERIMQNLRPLLARQHRMQVSARVTVTPENVRLKGMLDEFISLGFHSVGFSPMLSAPTGEGEMDGDGLAMMLEEMVVCGIAFERAVQAGGRYPFLNMVNALKEIHRGTNRPHPCGAGAGYFGVSAEGGLFACHRFVNDAAGAMGSVAEGVSAAAQQAWLQERHVDRQQPCAGCWARYLCGGGCHHEVIHRGRVACDFIRGWLHYTLAAYCRLCVARPDYFAHGSL